MAVVIAFEGVDLCGKSVLIAEVQRQIVANGRTCKIVPAVDKSVPGVEFLAKGLKDQSLSKEDRRDLFSSIHKLVIAHVKVISGLYDFILLDRTIHSFIVYNLNDITESEATKLMMPFAEVFKNLDLTLVCLDIYYDEYVHRLRSAGREIDWTDIHSKADFQRMALDYLRIGICEGAKFLIGGSDPSNCRAQAENLLKDIVYENGYKLRKKDGIIKKLS